jgi:hypothetical protein
MMFQILSKMAAEGFAIASTRFASVCRALVKRLQRRKGA